jgi:UDPglucose--hexose-1-phosphate uridylyltransferase
MISKMAPCPTSEVRFSPWSQNAVIISKKRSLRPGVRPVHPGNAGNNAPPDSKALAVEKKTCGGCHDELTPPQISVYYLDNDPEARVRVVPNKYSCFGEAPSDSRYQREPGFDGIADPDGRCEVLFEVPASKHSSPFYNLSTDEVDLTMRAVGDRYKALRSNPKVRFFFAFKNDGKDAGGTLRHPHWQIYFLPFIPPEIQARYERAAEYFNHTGRSLFRDVVSAEIASGERVIKSSKHFVTFVPFAAEVPYQVCISPLRDSADFSEITPEERRDVAESLRDAVARLCGVHPNLAFNIVLNTAAYEHASAPWYCWHLMILPRLTTLASVELGLHVMVNPVSPEDAATALRKVPTA